MVGSIRRGAELTGEGVLGRGHSVEDGCVVAGVCF